MRERTREGTTHGRSQLCVGPRLTLDPYLSCSSVFASPPAADVDSVDPVLAELASLRAAVAETSAAIQQWHAEFKQRTGRKPTSAEMMADATLAALLKQLTPSKRRVAALEKITQTMPPAGNP